MASLAAMPTLADAVAAPSPSARRLQAEWALLGELVRLNPDRLADPAAHDTAFSVTLLGTPALAPDGSGPIRQHRVRVVYPRFFPALPLELSLDRPMLHPNIHPETGFVCLWDRHRVAHSIEHALHKTAAMLGWRLFNLEPEHTMQPGAAALIEDPAERERLRTLLDAAPLRGVPGSELPPAPATLRRRLQ